MQLSEPGLGLSKSRFPLKQLIEAIQDDTRVHRACIRVRLTLHGTGHLKLVLYGR